MYIYLILIGTILIADLTKSKKTTYMLFWILVIFTTSISACRYMVGTDYRNYLRIFDEIKYGYSSYVESGYYLLNKIMAGLGGTGVAVISIAAIFTNLAFAHTIVKNESKEFVIYSLFIYICSELYFLSMNVLRQYIAIGILLIGFEHLKRRKYVIYLIYVGIAMLFHTSAIFALLLALFIYLNDKKPIIGFLNIALIVSLLFIFVDLRPIVQNLLSNLVAGTRWNNYINGYQDILFYERSVVSIYKLIIPNVIWFLMYFYVYGKNKSEHTYEYMIGWFFYVFLSNLFHGIPIFQRVYNIFEYNVIYLIPFIIKLGKTKNQQIVIKILITAYYFTLTYVAIFYLGSNHAVPYQTFFSNK